MLDWSFGIMMIVVSFSQLLKDTIWSLQQYQPYRRPKSASRRIAEAAWTSSLTGGKEEVVSNYQITFIHLANIDRLGPVSHYSFRGLSIKFFNVFKEDVRNFTRTIRRSRMAIATNELIVPSKEKWIAVVS